MGASPIYVLPGFLLGKDEAGKMIPAAADVSGEPLFAGLRLEAACKLSETGVRFCSVGSAEQINFMLCTLPGAGHFAVRDPDNFPPNTLGNIEQVRSLNLDLSQLVCVTNLYHTYRWHEWLGVRCLPAEVVLTAKYSWGYDELAAIYGTSQIARDLADITLACAHRLATGSGGWLSVSEITMHQRLIAQLPIRQGGGSARGQILAELTRLFDTPYLCRLLDEWCGIADIRGGTYLSLRPRPDRTR